MTKIAVLMAEGYEEGETLFIVDLLRRAGLECNTFAFNNEQFVKGMHGMYIQPDCQFSDEVKNYDMIVLPGGRPGGANLKANPDVIKMLHYYNENNKYIAAMCSGTTVLEEAQVITGKKVTGYTGYAEKLPSGQFTGALTEFDQNIITSQGPATGLPFAFRIMEVLGIDPSNIKYRLMYDYAGGK